MCGGECLVVNGAAQRRDPGGVSRFASDPAGAARDASCYGPGLVALAAAVTNLLPAAVTGNRAGPQSQAHMLWLGPSGHRLSGCESRAASLAGT